MANRDVTVTIKVRDGEVTTATANLNNLEKAARNVGNTAGSNGGVDRAAAAAAKRLGISYDEYIQKVRIATGETSKLGNAVSNVASGPAPQAAKAISQVKQAAAGAGEAVGGMGTSMLAIVGVAAAVVIAIAAVIYVAVQLAQKIFEVTKAFADYALGIGKLSEETGLAAETVSALSHEAERQGRSFDILKGPLNEFRKNIGQAAAGSEEARAKLKVLGIDGTKAISDVDGAFRTAITTIVSLPAGMKQAEAAYAAFGTEGYKLLPFLKEFHGDVDAAIKKAEELGIVISGKNVQAAREFNRAYADLKKTITDLAHTFGREFLPVVTQALKDFGQWLTENKGDIKSWAEWSVSWVQTVIDRWKDLMRWREALQTQDQEMRSKFPETRQFTNPQAPGRPPVAEAVDANQVYGTRTQVPGLNYNVDPAALEAMRAAAEKLRQDREKETKAELAAQIQIFENHIQGIEKVYDTQFKKITEKFKETGDVAQYEAVFGALREWYGGVINDLGSDWSKLVEKQTLAEKQGQNQRYLVWKTTQDKLDALGQKTLDFEDAKSKAIADHQKKSSADYLKNLEAEMNRAIELRNAQSQTNIAQITRDHQTLFVSERQMIDQINKLERDSLNFRKELLDEFLTQVTGNAEKELDVKHKIAVIGEQIAQQEIKNADRITAAEKKKQEAINDLRKKYEDYKLSLEDQLDAALRNNRALTEYEQTLRDIQRGVIVTTDAERERLLVVSAQIDAVNELNRQHAELKDFFSQSLRYVFEGDFEGLFKNLKRGIQDKFIDGLSDWLATNILGFDPNQTNNPVAKPIVGKIEKTNQILNAILGRLGGTPLPGLGGSFGNIFSGLGGIGPGGTGVFNGGGGGSAGGSSGGLAGIFQNLGILGGGGGSGGSGGGDIFAQAQAQAQQGQQIMLGLTTAIGGAIGGRAGRAIQYGALGFQIGAAFGPIGAVIGAAAGALIGLFGGGDPKRKRDKQEKIPALNKGFTDAIAELRKILADSQSLRFSDPQEAVTRAEEVRAQIASGFGIQFESKKYRKQSQQLIAARLREAEPIIEQIKQSAAIAAGAADRRQRILPEFAGGYFADYFKPNGLLPGMFDGRDNILAMISRGEMVLNPGQIARVKALAGGDIFAGAGIPNYPNASASPRLAMGGLAGAGLGLSPNVIMQPNFTLIAEGIVFTDAAKFWLESDDGKRTLVKVIKKEKEKDRTL